MGPYNTIVANDYETCKEVFTKPEFQGRVDAFPVQFRMSGKKLGKLRKNQNVFFKMF